MARTRVRIPLLLALSATLVAVADCGSDDSPDAGEGKRKGGPRVVVTTTWEGAFAKAAGAEDIKVIVPQSVHHAPDYDPKPSDLAAVAKADFVLYAPFEPYAEKIKEAAGSKAELIEVALENEPGNVKAEVTRLAGKFGTQSDAAGWNRAFDTEYATLRAGLKSAWPGGRSPSAVSHAFSRWAADMAGITTVGTFGPEPVTPGQLSGLSGKKPALVLDNAHMSTGTVLPDSGAEEVDIVNYPGDELDLLTVYRDAAAALKKAMGTG
ncbi:zinc ABC transporter substrate-binding protein [Streptomyces sp. NPDC006798]|uniref:metal ABC transporter solute-binding protein, Zn/Mn family n=1 Tax=Streptomyces sp. NPDC006798 TaxID=3155462 RepID=UPI0033F13F8C